ncbi:hypothetical protein P3X46_012813 [Hevea brasiliensis]|uniref:RNase H type-1 domain-containing protein n=1 Tax=Hevea brasiliensis TaxID=3981 RepID=A0ABQ9MDP2_HEVBR|nr:uncharacterized protein LOC131181422 [Hevea brasiliensis]KAJ9177612.1 hypothetical protein P3X46_012813 [Hevea brasiliensis]
MTIHHFEEFNLAHQPTSLPSSTLPLIPATWIPLPTNVLKLNFDAAVNSSRNGGATTVVVRNSEGQILDWAYKKYNFIIDPLVLESLACRDAALLAVNRGFHYVVLEGNSLLVINAVKNSVIPQNIQQIIYDVRQLSLSFTSISFSHVRRTCNLAAHALATKFLHESHVSCNWVA